MSKAKIPLMQIEEPLPDTQPCRFPAGFIHHPFWDLAFRPMFLLASIFSIVSLLIWIASINGIWVYTASAQLPALLWHVHEMIFGFALAIAVGFLLTAVQTWTGQRSLHGIGLIVLTASWLVARVALWLNQPFWLLLGSACQLIWWGVAIYHFARLIVKAGQKRQFIFIVLMSFIALFNMTFLLSAWLGHSELALHLARTAILLFAVIISVLAGRVIPFFTGRGAAQYLESKNLKIKKTDKLDSMIFITSVLAAGIYFLSFVFALAVAPAIVFLLLAGLHLIRLMHWHSWQTRNVPLLWSLHLSYLALAIGTAGLGLSYFIDSLRFADALHIITLGAIGAMILAMMARVSLGHTGRALNAHFLMSIAFVLVFFAVIARFVFAVLQEYLWAWNLSALLWMVSFAIFVVIYLPVLVRARLSGLNC